MGGERDAEKGEDSRGRGTGKVVWRQRGWLGQT